MKAHDATRIARNHEASTCIHRNDLGVPMTTEVTAEARCTSLMGAANDSLHPVSPSDVAAVCTVFSGLGRAGALA